MSTQATASLMAELLGPPARSTRRPVMHRAPVVVSLVLLAIGERALVAYLPEVARGFGAFLDVLAPVPVETGRFVGADVPRLAFTMPFPDYLQLVLWVVGAMVAIVAIAELRRLNMALRLVLAFETVLVGASAVTSIWAGRPPFDAGGFATLYSETAVTVWLVLPVLTGVLSLAFPFRLRDRAVLVLGVLAYSFVLSAVRYVFFAEVLGHAGSVLMAPLYLSLGPLVDIVGAVSLFSLLAAGTSARLRSGPALRGAWLCS